MAEVFKKIKKLIIPSKENNYRPYFLLSKSLLVLIVLFVLLKFVSFSFLCFFPNTSFFSAVSKSVLLNLTNQKRSNSGVAILKENNNLNRAAYLKAQDMLKYDYFAHTSPLGRSPWYWLEKSGYNYRYAGENLAIDFIDSGELFQAWYSSSVHRANIVNPRFKEIGMAVLKGDFKGRRTTVVVQYFGTQLNIPSTYAKTITTKKTQKTISRKISQPQKTYTQTPRYVSTPGGMTLSDYYRNKGQHLPSIQERAKMYEEFNLGKASSYYGLSWQNALLLNKLLEIDKSKSVVKKSQETPVTKEKITPTPTSTKEAVSSKQEITQEEVITPSPTLTKTPEEITKPEIAQEVEKKGTSLGVKAMNFLVRNYNSITRTIFLSVFALVFLSFCLDIFIKVNIQHADIVLRGVLYSSVLLALLLLDKSIILKLLPHSLGVL
ncbi:MAG: CAP domain-containing protein [Candidatus Pacebacteria bacterium]|nr:CAP domain-containing protein [Candidatus Paceibacterota bacterium]